MGQKDISQKALESLNDVFADIVNGIIFNGKDTVKEEDLEDALTISVFSKDSKLHEQNRDVAKIWKENNIRVAFVGIENQTKSDQYMPLRLMAYDGACYKRQLIDIDRASKDNCADKIKPYPVVSLVLYFGEKPWNYSKSLLESVNVRPELRPFVNDYKPNVIEIIGLTEEDIEHFSSDFRSLIDIVKFQYDPTYKVSDRVIDHKQEFAWAASSILGDTKIMDICNFGNENVEGEELTVCKLVDRLRAEGEVKTLADLVKDGILTLQQAAERVGMSVANFKDAAKNLGILL